MSEPDRSYSREGAYQQGETGACVDGKQPSASAQLMSSMSQQAQAAELCEDGASTAGFGSPQLASNAARAGLGQTYISAMSRHAQAAELRAAWSAGVPGSQVVGSVAPGEAAAPNIGVPLIYRSDGKGVEVELLLDGAPPSGWTVVEPGARTWALYYALYRARTDPGEVDFAALGPVVGEVFGPQLMAGLPGMGPWGKPDGLPGGLYVGTAAHTVIGEHYKARNAGRLDIYTNYASVAMIAADLKTNHGPQYQHLRPELGGPFKPDITDAGLKLVYEVKPAWSAAVGRVEVQAYAAALERTGLTVSPGPRGVPGTKGKLAAPAGWFTFDVVMPGVIGYRYVKTEPVPELLPLPERVPAREGERSRKDRLFEWRYWEEVTGLTGVALLAYLIISEGSRIIPARNLIPVP